MKAPARLLAAGLPPARPMAPRMLAALALPEKKEEEREVVAEPRLQRDVFVYLEPRPGIDGTTSFCQCGSCTSFVPEAAMHGAVVGDRCAIFGSNFPIDDDSSCNLYVPTSDGKPCGGCVAHAAEKMVKGMRGSVLPYNVGFVRDVNVRCANCAQFDGVESCCTFFEKLNEELPLLFDLDMKVKPAACCDGFVQIPDLPME
jgi:hypothetical protein